MARTAPATARHRSAPIGARLAEVDKLLGLVNSGGMSQALSVAAELGIADLLAAGPKDIDALAAAAGCQAASLHRLMRALASIDLFQEREDGSFALTALGSLLRADSASSLRSWVIWWGRYQWSLWANLLHSVRTGESARRIASGTEGFEHLERDAEAAAIFSHAMAEFTRFVARGVVHSYDFSGIGLLVDVGGGYGELLGTILAVYPAARGVLFDRPFAMDGARAHLDGMGVGARCEVLTGDFFDSVPSGAEAYLLKSVIHDWDDDRSTLILRNCREAMALGGKLLLVEQIRPDRIEPSPVHQDVTRRDLSMLLGPGGRERTAREFRDLLEAGGFRLDKIVPAAVNFCVIEAVPS